MTRSLDGQHQDVDRTPRGSQSEWQRTGINRESTSMVWPTLGSRTAEEQNRTHGQCNAWPTVTFPTADRCPWCRFSFSVVSVHVLMLSIQPCVVFLACVHLALFLALSLSPRNSLVSSRRDHSMLASLLLTVPSLLQLCSNCSHRNTSSVCPAYTQATRLAVILTNCLLPHYQWLNMIAQLRGVTWSVLRFHRGSKLSLSPVIKWTQSCEKRPFRRKTHKMLIRPGHWVTS